MVKMKGLGRGLDALLAGGGEEENKDRLQNLQLDQLQPGKYQPRTHMDQESLAELAESIKSQGIMQPILARALIAGSYEIIAGERRWRAARLAGLTEVPVLVRVVADEAALAMSLIENIQRENLNPLEEATGIQRLINEFDMTHQLAAEAVGRSRSAVSNLLRLLNLAAPVQELLMHNQLDMGHARALLSLPNVGQITVANEIVGKGLSVREAERLVQRQQQPANSKPKTRPDRDILRLQEDLAEKLGAIVTLKTQNKGRGKLIINYDSLEQLDNIIGRLSER
ncbi:chromosome segregation DNA-binding protein [Sulfuricella denitrificans skB26]|uniref:Chromosome segregation DNA-binding protein n=1 Tax=Sulfuricella denitrificans (strain DSM 22764 / NBRC 105220 / skB26) TaxID=1163617 RepID=S6B929_SULDS|nr:ParB/RepB/Spo0J family partition protein [Sulfuricella denitrificans]BAN36827.1 chromosome segregation DNA-binding protein [Sulfuricella denitrificans skB26]